MNILTPTIGTRGDVQPFIALAQGLGLALSARGDRAADPLVPLAVVAAVAGYALTARRLPAPPVPEVRPGLADLKGLVADPRLLLLLGTSALHWAGCAPFHLFYGVFVRDLALSSSLTGLGMASGDPAGRSGGGRPAELAERTLGGAATV